MSTSPLAIAVVGLGALFPGRLGTDGFWRDILDGRDAVRDVPPTHWLIEDYYDADPHAPDKTYCRRGAFLDPVPFSPIEMGLPPVVLPSTDTAQILALVVAKQVLAEAERVTGTRVDRHRTSVILGVASATELVGHYSGRLSRPAWVKGLREEGLPEDRVQAIADRIAANFVPWSEASFPGLLGNVVAGRIANRFDLGGANFVTDAACASSLSALQASLRELTSGDSDLVITGGVDALNDILMFMCFSKTPAFSPTGDCRPFSDRADGTIIGEGVGMLALRRLEDAERDGNRIYAVIRGLGASSDGRATSVYAPRPQGQALALERAYAQAGYAPSTVELVEAHGTGTVAGDAAEVASLRRVFDPDGAVTASQPWCALGSVKSQIGHTKAAAGSAGLIKTVLALHHRILPPTIKIDRPNPRLGLSDSPFYLNTQARPWIRADDHPRRASVSAFGFGGSNFHVTLEEYRGPLAADRIRHLPAELVLFSSSSPQALAERIRTVAGRLSHSPLAQVARDACTSFEPDDPHRLAIVASDETDLRVRLEAALDRIERNVPASTPMPGAFWGEGLAAEGRVAFLFPGQGSQYVNMGADLAMAFDECRATWDAAATVKAQDGQPLHRVVCPPPAFTDDDRRAQEATLTALEHAQPAIAMASLAQLALLDAVGLRADCTLGHSFGEVMALHAAGVFDAAQALAIADRRGRLMADAAAGHDGAMIAVPLARVEIDRRLASWQSDLVVANDNAPAQVILSGTRASIDAAVAVLASEGVTSVRLAVGSAFHSPIVASSRAPFEAALAAVPFQPPAIPVVANSTAAPYPADPDRQRALLAGQIAETVRFRDAVTRLYDDGVRIFIEVGPGDVLTRLVGQILDGRPYHAIAIDRRRRHGVIAWLEAIGRLAALGRRLDYDWLFRATPPRDSDAPVRTDTSIDVLGVNYGKPYPPPGGASALPAPNVSHALMPDTPASFPPPTPRIDPSSVRQPSPMPLSSVDAVDATSGGSDLAALVVQVAETHRRFQQEMSASHQSFLGMVERVLTGVRDAGAVSTGAIANPLSPPAPPPPTDAWMAPPPVAAANAPVPMRAVQPIDEPIAPRASAVVTPTSLGASDVSAPSVAFVSMAPATAPVNASARDVLLAVVSEKTGYPIEMLDLDMEIEAQLGIDSIKQVEILSAFRERRPDLPEIEPHRLASLRTLGAIAALVDDAGVVDVPSPAQPVASSSGGLVAHSAGHDDAGAVLLAIVSDKTGYPIEMLDLDMEIEAQLGIDSIKQVEILSAFRERRPDLPEIGPGDLGSLRTLGAIVAFASRTSDPVQAVAVAPVVTPARVIDPSVITRRRLTVVPAPRTGMAMPRLSAGMSVSVTGGSPSIRTAVVRALRARGVDAQACDEPAAASRGLIVLDAIEAAPTQADATRLLADVLARARTFVRHFGAEDEAVFVTVQDTGGTFGLEADPGDAAWCAGLPALGRTLAAEHGHVAIKAIDVARAGLSDDAFADLIAEELLLGGPATEVGLPQPGRRVVVVTREAPVAASGRHALADGQVVVASGGARGITAHVLMALAREARLRLVLLGRTQPIDNDPLPDVTGEAALRSALAERARQRGESLSPREIAAQASGLLAWREIAASMAALRTAGAKVRYVAVDVREGDAVARVLADVRAEWGPIGGLLHAAGVIADKRLADKTDEQIDRVLGTKLDGLAHLLDATREDSLAWLCLFSSVSARVGNIGQSDYAVANEVLNKVARREARRRPDCLVSSIAWGPWEGGMVTPLLRDQFATRGVPLIDLDAGAAFLVRELTGGDEAVEVIAGSGDLNQARNWTAEVVVSSATHPYLKDHVVGGRPVVPVVLGVEWALRLARVVDPLAAACEVRDFSVVRPLALPAFAQGDVSRFLVTARTTPDAPHSVAVSVTDREGRLHCAATVDLRPAAQEPTAIEARPAAGQPWPWDSRGVYDGPLFHGPDFQVMRSLDALSETGAVCTVAGVDEQGWPGGPWMTDPAALDGAFQLAAAWGFHRTSRPFLPMRVARLRWFGRADGRGPVRCTLTSRTTGSDKLVSELMLTTRDGQIVATIGGVEMFAVQAAVEVS
ncbi:MAG: hypothetical protein ABS36_15940 [Acidobacteria bacterium SCN 69-37]|nr:MAG: hypothetical protein ABS36_15940 [Acidobacteria bacterium SCN 69-37]